MLRNSPSPMIPDGGGGGSGGGTPGGSPTQLQYDNSGAFGGVSGSAVSTNGSLTLGGATVTTNDPVLNMTQTWNAGGVTFTGVFFNLTNTASANFSKILDLQVGGTSKLNFAVPTLGNPQLNFGPPTGVTAGFRQFGNGAVQAVLGDASQAATMAAGQFETANSVFNDNTLYLNNANGQVQFGASSDPTWRRIASSVLELNNGTAGTLTGSFFQWGGQARVTSDFPVTNSAVLTNITGLSVTLSAGRTYSFEAQLFITDAAAGGVQAAIAGTCTATNIQYTGWTVADNAIKGKTNATALATAVGSTLTTETSGIMVQIYGTITVNAAGTLTVQLAQNTSNGTATTAKRGSTFYVYDMQ